VCSRLERRWAACRGRRQAVILRGYIASRPFSRILAREFGRVALFFLRRFFAAGSASVASCAAPPSASVAAPVGVAAPSCSSSALATRFVPLWGASVVVAHLRPSSACAAAPPICSCSGCRDAVCACRGLASGVGGSVSGVAGVSSMSLSDGVIALLAPALLLASCSPVVLAVRPLISNRPAGEEWGRIPAIEHGGSLAGWTGGSCG